MLIMRCSAVLFAAATSFCTSAIAHVTSPRLAQSCDLDSLQSALGIATIGDNWGQTAHRTEPTAAVSTELAAVDVSAPRAQIALVKQGPRQVLADFALQLRNIRYRRGGRDPSTGFDCSGFVHYVFLHTMGLDLPSDAPGQYVTGQKIARDDMQMGDLVFFHNRGQGISHVGIYLEDGRFIHSPSPGKSVRIDRLDDAYWTRHFVGARRLANVS